MKNFKEGTIIPFIGVIVALLVVGGAYYYAKSDKASAPEDSVATTTGSEGSKADAEVKIQAGITVTSPQPNEIVKLPITVRGSINGKGWFANEGEVGTAQVFDANGKSVSNVEILAATTDWLKLPTSFQAVVGDREMMAYLKTDTGVVRITSTGAKDGDTTSVIEIPVRFK